MSFEAQRFPLSRHPLSEDAPVRTRTGPHARSYAAAAARTAAPLLVTDVFALAFSILAAITIAGWLGASSASLNPSWTLTLSCNLLAFLAFCGVYPGVGMSPVVEFQRISTATTLGCVSYSLAVLGLDPSQTAVWPLALLAWPLMLVSITVGRALARSALAQCSWWGFYALVVGDGTATKRAYHALQSNPGQGLHPVQSLQGPEVVAEPEDGLAGPTLEVEQGETEGGQTHFIHYAVLAISNRSLTTGTSIIRDLGRRFRRVLVVVPETSDSYGALWMRVAQCGALPGFEIRDRLVSHRDRFLKRSVDLALVFLASPALLLLIPAVCALLKLTSRGPLFFGHDRIGEDGRYFKAWKFRTMVVDAELQLEHYLAENPQARDEWESKKKLQEDPRVTSVGRWLRRTSLDELPQLWNVFLAEMSIVGPRPIITEEVAKYDDSFELYARARPGITGLWQISGRNDTTYPERVALDSFYVRNWSVWLDLYILSRTVGAVLTGRGAS
jgi:Undecaprenyl-phosphate galactose phosphotransferase WbaP